jgi:TPR repeat protein
MIKSIISNKKLFYPLVGLSIFVAIYLGRLTYGNYLINSFLSQFKSTGIIDRDKLSSAINFKGNDDTYELNYLWFLANYMNWVDDTASPKTLDVKNICSEVISDDWKAIAVANVFTNSYGGGWIITRYDPKFSNDTILKTIQTNLENVNLPNKWFWIFVKGLSIYKGINGFDEDKELGLSLVKQSADLGFVEAMANAYDLSSEPREKFRYANSFVESNPIVTTSMEGFLGTVFYRYKYSVFNYNLGVMYWSGEGVDSINYDTACYFFKRAAELDDPYGLAYCGLCAENGFGNFDDGDEKAALDYYLKAGEYNQGFALYRLSQFYKNGIVVEQDYNTYLSYLSKAASSGNTEAISEKKSIERARVREQESYTNYSYEDNSNNEDISIGGAYEQAVEPMIQTVEALLGKEFARSVRKGTQKMSKDMNSGKFYRDMVKETFRDKSNDLHKCQWCPNYFRGDGYGYNRPASNSFSSCRATRYSNDYCSPQCAIAACDNY